MAPHLEAFLADLFGIGGEISALAGQHSALAPLYACKRLFVQRRAARAFKAEEAAGFDADGLRAQLSAEFGGGDQDLVSIDGFELAFATAVTAWQAAEAENAARLDLATRYAAWALLSSDGRARQPRASCSRRRRRSIRSIWCISIKWSTTARRRSKRHRAISGGAKDLP